MGAQYLHQKHDDLIQIKSKYINNASRNHLWKKVMEAQAKRTWLGSWMQKMEAKGGQKYYHLMKPRRNVTRNNYNVPVKMIKRKRARRAGQEGIARRCTIIEKKVRTLKKLIPNAGSSVSLDGLFRDTAEYISTLQMRVGIMQAVVNALSNSESV